jgi:hypothetical protein
MVVSEGVSSQMGLKNTGRSNQSRALIPVIDIPRLRGMFRHMKYPAVVRMLPLLALAGLASCASRPESGITRVKIYRLDPQTAPDAAEPAIAFEQKHYLYGAVSDDDREARRGNYYTVFFRTPDRTTPVQAKFEYRQASTGFRVFAKEATVEPRRGFVRFNVTGEDYRLRGRLLGWRVTLAQGGHTLGERNSFLWE